MSYVAQKKNRIIRIPEEKAEEYAKMGYEITNENGKVVAAAAIETIERAKEEITRLTKELGKAGTENEALKAKLEKVCGHKIEDKDISRSIEIYNENRLAMQEFYRITAENPGVIGAKDRHIVAKSSYFMDKEEHTTLVKALNALLRQAEPTNWTGKKIVLAGIIAEPNEVLDILDEMHLAVVADELAHENRQFRTLVPQGIDQLERLARQYQNMEACSVIYDPEKKRCQLIADLAKNHHADGVIYCQMKFCDPEEFDYPFVKKACEEAEIPLLNLEVDQLTETAGQARTRIQAFAEMLDM